ncbi:MAG: DMT family transporter [Candidatus Levybacteria bacterium]|nr:DMT family transporter [Candidatus Levybacteria bacterium]
MIYIFLATLFYSSAILVGAFASRMANTTIVAALINIVSAIIPTLVAIPILNKANIQNQRLGLIAALIAGVFIALFSIALTKSYSQNKVAVVVPIVFGGSILVSAILSYFFFKEKVTLFQGVGLGFLAIGLLIITYARFTGR